MLWLLSAFFIATGYGYTPEALKEQITNLPGLPSGANYTMFSGYITVNASHNRNLFYWFIESLNDPATDPLVLWTNGGPGCSGLLGLMTEQGPFRPQPDLTLQINDYSWVKLANMVFIEAPAGVGFSYSDDVADYATGDTQTANDNYAFIKGFLTKFPEYQTNDFYIASESYGGHYMPTLGKTIVQGNSNGGTPQINFKGIFVGNPYTDPVENAKGQYDTWWGHQLVPKPLYNEWYTNCKDGAISTDICLAYELSMIEKFGDLDPYALDYPVCPIGGGLSRLEKYWFLKKVISGALKRPLPRIYREKIENVRTIKEYQACSEDYEIEYLNDPAVQTAIHAKSTLWMGCSEKIVYNETDQQSYMEPYWQWLVSNTDLHMTIVSGDDDSVCGTLGTQSWLWNMGWTVNHDANWLSWEFDGQVAGYVTKWVNALNFVTVHNAGHMIPQTQPARSLQTFTNYLAGIF